MALNPSGAISLAGPTAGQSIAVELGVSATATISLNDTNVRTLAQVPSGVIVMPTDFYGKSNTSLPQRALWWGSNNTPTGPNLTFQLSNTGAFSTAISVAPGVSARNQFAGANYGGDKGIFAFGQVSAPAVPASSITNLVSNTGVLASDTPGAPGVSVRFRHATATYGTDKVIVGFGQTTAPTSTNIYNLISNTGVVAADSPGVGTARIRNMGAGYGTDKGIFGFGATSTSGASVISATNLVSNTGVLASDTPGVGLARQNLAALSFGSSGQAMFCFGTSAATPAAAGTVAGNITNFVSNTGVVASNTPHAPTVIGRAGPTTSWAANYGGDKGITIESASTTSNYNLISNTGVIAASTPLSTGGGRFCAASYSK